jgi:phosphatidylserine/phosphatidylglycerophosphate/cardiolipin synthase-like enzyme
MNELSHLVPIIQQHAEALKVPGVASIRPGYRTENGWLTKEPAIVVVAAQGAGDLALPAQVGGVKVEVRQATEVEELRHADPARYAKIAAQRRELAPGAFPEVDPPAAAAAPAVVSAAPDAAEAQDLAAKPQIAYTPATVARHASPDAGWPTLRAFLAATQRTLTVGLYDFTSKHILDEVEKDLLGAKTMAITLDNPAKNPTADQADSETLQALGNALGASFTSAWALVRSNAAVPRWIFPTAYHIKVAVRDSESVWVSSGNWNNSNQPDIDPIGNPQPGDQATAKRSDRDWHVIIDHEGLAKTFEAYLKHDFDVATQVAGGGAAPLAAEPEVGVPASFQLEAKAILWQFHPPLHIEGEQVTITPLLTPDAGVYQPAMLKLLQSARTKLYIQLQYIHPSDAAADADFNALIDAVVAQIAAGVDVRIIVSQYQTSNGWLDRLQAAGVDAKVVKIQNGVHNKGFVLDGTTVALGSENWSGDGVLRNRDATVIIENATAAAYYEKLFIHDWEHVARQSVAP